MSNFLSELFTALMTPSCQGCGERYPLKDQQHGHVIPREGGHVEKVLYCTECWEMVDCADPVTGAYGAAACDVRRATPSEIEEYYGRGTNRSSGAQSPQDHHAGGVASPRLEQEGADQAPVGEDARTAAADRSADHRGLND